MSARPTTFAANVSTGSTGYAPVAGSRESPAPERPGPTTALPAPVSATFGGKDAKTVEDRFLAQLGGEVGLPYHGTGEAAAGDTSHPPVVPAP